MAFETNGIEAAIKFILADTEAMDPNPDRQALGGQLNQYTGGRVVPLDAGSRTNRPFIAYEITSEADPLPSHSGPSGITLTGFDVVIVAETYREVIAIGKLTRALLDGYAGTAKGVSIGPLRYTDQTDVEQAPATGAEKPDYLRSQSFTALHQDAS